MKSTLQRNIIGIPLDRKPKGLLTDAARLHHIDQHSETRSPALKKGRVHSVINRINKIGKKADSFAHGIREHVKLGPKISETVKGKLSLGAKILKVGGVEKIFKQLFNVTGGEKLIKASPCYLSTTAGPIAGLLFISTDKVAFCSEKSIKVSSPNGELIRIRYKVVIPVNNIKRINKSENLTKPSQKYIEIVTVDKFDFWFMGFVNRKKAFKNLQQAIISQSQRI